MKLIWNFAKPIVQIIGILFGGFVAVDAWIVTKVQTSIAPLDSKVTEHIKSGEVVKSVIMVALERLELESRMSRSQQEDIQKTLNKIERGMK